MQFILILIILLCSSPVEAARNKITRGPYLQDLTHNSVTIRWRTKKPSTTLIKYQEDTQDAKTKQASNLVLTKEHQIKLVNLKPNSNYKYIIYGLNKKKKKVLSEEYLFKTIRVGKPKHIWVLGDPGTSGSKSMKKSDHKNQIRVRDAYYQYKQENKIPNTDFILSLGDNAYIRGKDKEFQKGFFEIYQDIFSSSPVYPVLGNHDAGLERRINAYSARSYPKPQGVYYDSFTLPGDRQAYYSFDYDNVHVIALDSYDSLWEDLKDDHSNYEKVWAPSSSSSNAMLEWLKQDLANNNAKWTIAMFHHPPFSKDLEEFSLWQAWIKAHVVPLLQQYKVDLVLSGHIHNYQRSYPLVIDADHSDSTPNRTKPEHKQIKSKKRRKVYHHHQTIELAEAIDVKLASNDRSKYHAGGGPIYLILGSSGSAFKTLNPEENPRICSKFQEAGSLILDIDDAKLSAKFLSDKNKILDKFTISKE